MLTVTEKLTVRITEPVAWWCPLHGTVTRCPFRYMYCDTEDPEALDRIMAALNGAGPPFTEQDAEEDRKQHDRENGG